MKPQFIDVHAHVNFSAFDADRKDVIKRAQDAGVWVINVGTQKDTSKSAVALAEKYSEGVYAIIGLHPIHTSASHHDKDELGEEAKAFNSREEFFDKDFYRELAKPASPAGGSKKVVGIGECGLDFFHVPQIEVREKQVAAFRGQIELAIELDLPLMIHCREAYAEALVILNEYKKNAGDKLRGDFHFFAGDIETAQKILDLGFNISFTGVITFARDYEKLVKYVPLDRMMSETDCPYVTPVPNRGKRNEPANVRDVVSKIARIRGEDFEKVRVELLENALKFFKLQK